MAAFVFTIFVIRSPWVTFGQTALTVMPYGPSSSASVLVRPRTAHFDEEYPARLIYPRRPLVPDM